MRNTFKNIKIVLLAMILILNIIAIPFKASAEEGIKTEILMTIDKKNYNIGDTVTVSIKSKIEANILGIQFQMNYDPTTLSMQGNDITYQGDYTSVGGETVDKTNGILIYPLVNYPESGNPKASMDMAIVRFKAIKAGTTVIKLSDITAADNELNTVNSNDKSEVSLDINSTTTPPVTPPSGGGGEVTPPTQVVIPVVTTTDSNSNVIATVDSSKIDKNANNIINIGELALGSKLQVQIPAISINNGTGNLTVQTSSASLNIPIGSIDSSLLNNDVYLRISINPMSNSDASAILANIPEDLKLASKVLTLSMAICDKNNNVISEIHNFANNKNVIVTFNLTNDDIKGMDPSKISAFFYDVTLNKWVELGGSYDVQKLAYTFNTTHFTNFAIMQKSISSMPKAPVNLSAVAAGTASINLNWTAVDGAKGYYLYRSTTIDGIYIKVNDKLITTTSYIDMGLMPSTKYYYRTVAVNFEGLESEKSISAETTTLSPAITVKRLSGSDRIETSIAIAKEQYTDKKPDAVVLATANDFPDALSGSGLAYKYNAPMLLVNKSVNGSKTVLDFIATNLSKGKNIYILGETGAVSKEISDYLASQGYNIIRLGGKDRYETNQKIVNYLNSQKGTSLVIATGSNFADALSISSIADIKGFPILLNGRDNISANVSNYIANIKPTTIYLIGGTGVLSANIETQIKKLNGNITIVRLGGADRYETSMKISEYFNLNTTTITLATGTNFPDALSGSVLAAKQNASVLLVDNKDITKQKNLIEKQNIYNIILFGGEGVISKAIADSLIKK